MDEYEEFKAQLKSTGGNSLFIIIPYNIVKFANLQEKDFVKLMIKKIPEPVTATEDE